MNKAIHILFLLAGGVAMGAPTAAQVEFFESRIRPVLAQECYECHSEAGKQKGGLLLDSRPGWQAGGDSGAAITPGDLTASLLLVSIKHAHEDLKMPKNGAKLDDAVIADFEKWIAEGAHDPRDQAPTAAQLAKETDWSAVLERRKQWWSFQPVKAGKLDGKASVHAVAAEIDRQLMEKMKVEGLEAVGPTDAATLIRRATYILTGLPPTPEEVTQFVEEMGREKAVQGEVVPKVYERLVDRLLASPAYGERWARHWLDWVRYAESHGSEGDLRIPYAWRYRDYVIRAFNEDVRYPQMVKEAVAGDLLAKPRIKDGINESALGIGQLRMVLHGFSPTDSLDELVTFTDNQIDTVTKAFQGLTVSCARCHNHKFDAISQTDFYSLYGIFSSTRPAVVDVSAPGTGEAERAELVRLKGEIKAVMAEVWTPVVENMRTIPEAKERVNPVATKVWDMRKEPWFTEGQGIKQGVSKPGEFSVELEGEGIIARIHPSGYFSDLISTKDRAVIMTRRFKNEGGILWMRTAGAGGVKAKYVVQNYPRTGTIHRSIDLVEDKDSVLRWQKLDLNYWKGDDLFLQVTTVADSPVQGREDGRSWFGITDAFVTNSDENPAGIAVWGDPREAVTAWKKGAMTDVQAELLGSLLRQGKLPNDVRSVPGAAALLARYREVEKKLPVPTRAPGVLEADSYDAALFVRGDHKQPAERVPRRFLDGINPTPYETQGSGRLELAESLTDAKNPLTSRVMVNRLWHHVFGRGLVGTPDNFGRLGELPTHPELLDALAAVFQQSGGSMKQMIKALMLTEAFQREDRGTGQADQKDPQNKLLSHWTVRRLEAEAIRDSILMLSGAMNNQMYGDSVYGKDGRRSIYVGVIRNNLDPFLNAFDMPVPSSTRGNRDVTNVPAQSLALLNDPTIIHWSSRWANQVLAEPKAEARTKRMFMQALGRQPSDREMQASLAFVKKSADFARQQEGEVIAMEMRQAELQKRILQILNPVRQKLADGRGGANAADAPLPFAEWTFEKGGEDTQQRLPLKLEGGAKVEDGALILDGRTALARSLPLTKSLENKTLEAWVVLDTLDQKGGGVMTVQDRRGSLFDAIVYAERAPQEWLSGSNNHRRTQEFGGEPDTEVAMRPVHVAITYKGKEVRGYRDGIPYGEPYMSKEVSAYAAGDAEVLLGCRHGAVGGNRMLRGRILRARLYDRALTEKEVALSRHLESTTVTERDVLNALSQEKLAELERAKAELNEVMGSLTRLTENAEIVSPERAGWESLALSIINLKEFVYLK
ncbi:concanavalin A-like lectin/glucanase superfamily protein [Prosthecobacter fusiformis]|uniref:Concanavalin A-like lectin/glucanase superfamily protein n=1 Tax=Prosthecobacter fusiformis TaxID=48464 RepID=A0A4R7RP40_9BACT|nr:DUF1553 domain-containing protein [Prosthecobacter fusiformis]TDU67192.1 concanavalin A-like lectin/glucanase superfamily protein [Prosthecobacter fusiformis]